RGRGLRVRTVDGIRPAADGPEYERGEDQGATTEGGRLQDGTSAQWRGITVRCARTWRRPPARAGHRLKTLQAATSIARDQCHRDKRHNAIVTIANPQARNMLDRQYGPGVRLRAVSRRRPSRGSAAVALLSGSDHT